MKEAGRSTVVGKGKTVAVTGKALEQVFSRKWPRHDVVLRKILQSSQKPVKSRRDEMIVAEMCKYAQTLKE